MKNSWIALFAFLSATALSRAADVPIRWDGATPATGDYVIRLGTNSGVFYTNWVTTNQSFTLTNLAPGQYYSHVIARDVSIYTNSLGIIATNYSISEPSNEIGIKVTPSPLKYYVPLIQTSTNTTVWEDGPLLGIYATVNDGREFGVFSRVWLKPVMMPPLPPGF